MRLIGIIGLVAVAGIPLSAMAGSMTWNTCEGGNDHICVYGYTESHRNPLLPGTGNTTGTIGGSGQVVQFDANEDGTDLFVRAYRSANDLGAGPLSPTYISIWDGGLGAGGEDPSPNHAVDNIGRDEFLVFKAPSSLTWESFRVGWSYGSPEITLFVGDTLDDLMTAASIAWGAGGPTSGTWTRLDFTDVASDVAKDIDLAGQYLIIGATSEVDQHCHTNSEGVTRCTYRDGGEDAFKVLLVAADERQYVPEPGSLTLMGLGAAALVLRRRRPR